MAPSLAESQPGQVAEIKGQEEWDEAMKRKVVRSQPADDVTTAPLCRQPQAVRVFTGDAQNASVLGQSRQSISGLSQDRLVCVICAGGAQGGLPSAPCCQPSQAASP